MGLRPGRCYRKKKGKPYTRVSQRNPSKNYIKGVPGIKIKQFETGDRKKDFDLKFKLKVMDDIQIRHNAMESARLNANKYLVTELGEKNYFLKLLVYPHHVIRENPLATGAGVDRFQEGMRKSFGNPVGRSARVHKGQDFFEVKVPEHGEKAAREALRRAKNKLPCKCRIVQE